MEKTNNLIALGVTMITNLIVSFSCTIEILSWICFIVFVILAIAFVITLLQKEKSKCKTKEDYNKSTFYTNLPFVIHDEESNVDLYLTIDKGIFWYAYYCTYEKNVLNPNEMWFSYADNPKDAIAKLEELLAKT